MSSEAQTPKGPGLFRGVPNALTFLRLGAVPFFLQAVLDENYPLALALFAGAGITDILDGEIARRYHQQTRLGSFIDPMADKILGATAYVSFSLKGIVPPWLGALVFTRDIAISLGALVLYLLDMRVIARPSKLGKRTTLAQVLTIILALLGMFGPQKVYMNELGILNVCFFCTAALTIASGMHYLAMSFREYDNRLLMKPGAGD